MEEKFAVSNYNYYYCLIFAGYFLLFIRMNWQKGNRLDSLLGYIFSH